MYFDFWFAPASCLGRHHQGPCAQLPGPCNRLLHQEFPAQLRCTKPLTHLSLGMSSVLWPSWFYSCVLSFWLVFFREQETGDETVLQFGRVGKNKFTMDLQVPLNPWSSQSTCLLAYLRGHSPVFRRAAVPFVSVASVRHRAGGDGRQTHGLQSV